MVVVSPSPVASISTLSRQFARPPSLADTSRRRPRTNLKSTSRAQQASCLGTGCRSKPGARVLAPRSHVFVGFGPVVVVVVPLRLLGWRLARGGGGRRAAAVGSLKTGDPIDARTHSTAKPLWTRARPDEVCFAHLPASGVLCSQAAITYNAHSEDPGPVVAKKSPPSPISGALRPQHCAYDPAAVRFAALPPCTLDLQHRGVGSASARSPTCWSGFCVWSGSTDLAERKTSGFSRYFWDAAPPPWPANCPSSKVQTKPAKRCPIRASGAHPKGTWSVGLFPGSLIRVPAQHRRLRPQG